MKELILSWVIQKVLLPLVFWLDDENHEYAHKILEEAEAAKNEKITLSEYRRLHKSV
jgi:hypothetical protein